ncbi:MAG: NAD(+) diphosphatase [Atopobiaceae bacterium]
MIQDIEGHNYHNAYQARPAQQADYVLAYQDGRALLSLAEDTLALPRVHDFQPAPNPHDLTYCFKIDETYFYLLEGEKICAPEGFTFKELSVLRTAQPRWLAFAAITGWQLRNWYRDNAYCSRCGHRTLRVTRAREICCPACNKVVYPKIQPAVICGVTHKNKLLLTKYAGRRYTRFALVAGFTEIGETLEETCAREVKEETGLNIKNIRYYKDQPWSLTDTLLAGFFCELDGSPEITLDTSELKLGVWMDRDELPDALEDTSSLTNEMIMYFKHHPEDF